MLAMSILGLFMGPSTWDFRVSLACILVLLVHQDALAVQYLGLQQRSPVSHSIYVEYHQERTS